MGIEINNASGRTPQDVGESRQSTGTQAGSAADQGAKPGTAAAGSDRVALSNQAAQMQALEAQISNLPVVDTQRVEDVQHAIATRTLEVEPARVADKVLSFEAGLGPDK